MADSSTEKVLEEILQQIQQGKVALFLGAGASHPAGGPTGKKLTEMIKDNFLNIEQSLNDFIEVCQDVIDTPPYNRNGLEEFIRSKLDNLQPTKSHSIMTKYDWAAIFTSNFDDIVEVAYRTNPARLKPCQAICSERFSVNPSDRSKVCLFKIMGSITATEEESGTMVLSRADYNHALIRRRKYLELLSDFIKTGTTVFVGYSFGDRLVLDIIDDLIAIYGKDRLPWSYVLFHRLQPMDEKTKHMFSSRKIIPIECDFDSFFEFLDKNFKASILRSETKNIHIKLRGYTLQISQSDARQYAEYFEILSEESIEQQSDKDNFFMGTDRTWGAFKEDWDFKRDLYMTPQFQRTFGGKIFSGCLKEKIFDELKKSESEHNKVLLLTGMAGVGKTLTLRRVAYDVYKSGVSPVIIIKTDRINFDYKLLASFIETLNHELNLKLPQGQHTPPAKPLIIIDDAASLIRHVNRLKDYLTSRGRPALILAAERSGEWDMMWKMYPFRIVEENIYELSEQLTDDEKNRIIDHFYSLGYILTKGAFWESIIEQNFERSFFATIYTLVHPSKKPLTFIIQDQYEKLTDITQKAFQYICCFHQFNIPMNLELLVRALKCTYADFNSEVIGKDANKVIFEEQDEFGNILYRSHHRIIAKKTVDAFFGDPEMQKNIYLEIFKEAVLANRKERELCEKLLVEHIGPNAKPQMFSYDQLRQIFRIICEKNPIRSLVHHWGILEIDDHQVMAAERLLKWALEIPRDDIESYRGESDQNILTSLGGLYWRKGIDSIKRNAIKEADDYFEKAEAAFQSAKHGEFPNAYAYHSHAYMWYARGNQVMDEVERLNCYGAALEILSIAKDNLNEEELQQIYELETLIWSQIGDEKRIIASLETLRDKFNSARGYYLNAELLWRKLKESEGTEREKMMELALRKIEKALKFFPKDEHCLRLQCKLLKEQSQTDLKAYFEALGKWKAVATTPDAWLLYEAGRTAFILGYFDASAEFFRELETGVGLGHKLRSRPRNPILDEKGFKKEFEGVIINMPSSYEGCIRCETLRSLKTAIPFRPIASRFTPSPGDAVNFHIEFSYRGPRAENVKKRI